jgi:hypothetical protein
MGIVMAGPLLSPCSRALALLGLGVLLVQKEHAGKVKAFVFVDDNGTLF